MNTPDISPLRAAINWVKSLPSSSKTEESGSQPSDSWLRLKNTLVRPHFEMIQVVNGQNASGDLLRSIEITLATGRVLTLTLRDPQKSEEALASIVGGNLDPAFFLNASVE
jgi:hypothetical protein